MNSKDKETKTIQEKLKQFFRLKGATGNLRSRVDFSITEDIEKDIRRDAAIGTRTKTIKELSENVLNNRLEDRAIEKLWHCLEDLLHRDQPKEYRHLTFTFFRCLVQGQYERLGIMRAHFFRVIKQHDHPEDTVDRFELLSTLTLNGKEILYFEEEVGPFLLNWMPEITLSGKTVDYLALLVNLVKFNAAYLDEEVITGFVQGTCYLCCRSAPEQNNVVTSCLQLLETVVAYSTLPTESLCNFVVALCRTVNYEEYCQNSWRIMRNLLGTHMGHSALYTMCRFLQDPPCSNDYLLLRGAVFHVNQALWGTQPVASLQCTPTSILPSFIYALHCEHQIVVYEVMLSVQGLVDRRGSELHDPAWDVLLDIIKAVIVYVGANTSVNSLVAKHLHETLCSIERLMEQGKFNGSVPLVYELIESCAHARPESSVLRLVNYLAEDVVPTKHMWLSKLNMLIQRYYRQETRTNVRLMVLDILTNVVKLNRSRYEDEIIERIVVPYLQNVASDADTVVRNSCAKLLVELCLECDSKRCGELLDILDKILNRPYEVGNVDPISDVDLLDVGEVVCGLIKLFTIKMHRLPSSHAVRIYKMLVVHLENHYARPNIIENGSLLRYKIFDCFLNVRANSSYQVGCRNSSGAMQYSPYLCVMSGGVPAGRGPVSPPPPAPASPAPSAAQPTQGAASAPAQTEPATSTIQVQYVSLRHAFKVFITCLTQEKDWDVLHLVLSEIPKVMQNKALVLSKHGAGEIDQLASALCSMLTDKSLCLPESLRNTPKLSRSDFHQCVLPALASLASYHMYLDPACQQRIIRCMVRFGLVPRCSQQCITELTTCVLEMQDVMVKLLPEVLLDLSKISATVHIAVPVLEFLSTLTRLPTVFANFVGDQYMAVFAISLPYTNPFKYNHYIVSLAHHVIAVWFLKCRLPFRKDFVKFITTGLQTNTLIPFEETNVIRGDLMHMNEDSSNRKRSSSLTEQGSRRRPATSTAAMDLRPPVDKALHTFYEELTETCIDLMARYTFSPCSALPKRLPTTEFLLSGGQSMSWILGNKIITVTTSGCAQKPLRHGLCDKCWLMCQRTPDVDHCILNRSSSGGDRDESATSSGRATRQNSGEQKSATDTSPNSPVDRLDQLTAKLSLLKPAPDKQLCSCWCQGWAEIHVRRPTGDISWVTRIQNQIAQQVEFPLNDVSSLFLPSLVKEPSRDDPDVFNNDSDRGSAKICRSGSGTSNITSNTTVSTTTALNITTPTVYVAGSSTTSTVSIVQSNIGGAGVPYKLETGAPQTAVPTHLPVSTSATSVVPALSCEVSPGRETFHGPSSGPISIPDSRGPSRQSSHDSDDCETFYYEDGTRSRNPVRRSNSSPEMSASWKNPFMAQTAATVADGKTSDEGTIVTIECDGQKKSKKDMRVSCEAIPEEISGLGTTPPSLNTSESQHPSLLTCHSCPGDTGTTNVINLSTKPPQSPTQTSPALSRRSSEQKVSPIDKPSRADKKPDKPRLSLEKTDASIPPMRRDRGHTISVMSPVSKPRLSDSARRTGSPRPRESAKSGMNPSFVFLQLYHSAHFSNSAEKPLLVGSTQMIQRTVKILDRMPPYETHKIGVVYVGPGQCNNETEILRNKFGSVRYVEFLQRLGTLISLREADPLVFFLGGLAQDGNDGNFAYIWQDDVMQVIFHVATLMPSKESDPSCNDKKLHIGNNYVSIVYNESGEDFNIGTIKGQLNYANIIIQPLDYATNRVVLKVKEELSDYITHTEPKIISDQNLAIMVRQMALHANLASMVSRSIKAQGQDPYASNWLERLRKIKHLRARVTQEQTSNNSELYSSDDVGSTIRNKRTIQDFTEYT